MTPLVSIVMPAYNAARFLKAAIQSTQEQTYTNWELCIVDDGSEDPTAIVARTFARKDARIIVAEIPHRGCPSARNKCLEMCTGKIIAKLDADDTHEPQRLEEQVNYLLENREIDIVSCGMTWIQKDIRMPKPTVGSMLPTAYLEGKSNGPCCASLVTWKHVYDRVGSYNPNMLAGSDGDWNFRAIVAEMRWGHLPNYWYNQRRHSAQLSQSANVMQRRVHDESRKKYSQIFWSKR